MVSNKYRMLRNKYGFRWGAEIEMEEIVLCPGPKQYKDKTILFQENTLSLTTETSYRPTMEKCFAIEAQFGVYENNSVEAFIDNCNRCKDIILLLIRKKEEYNTNIGDCIGETRGICYYIPYEIAQDVITLHIKKCSNAKDKNHVPYYDVVKTNELYYPLEEKEEYIDTCEPDRVKAKVKNTTISPTFNYKSIEENTNFTLTGKPQFTISIDCSHFPDFFKLYYEESNILEYIKIYHYCFRMLSECCAFYNIPFDQDVFGFYLYIQYFICIIQVYLYNEMDYIKELITSNPTPISVEQFMKIHDNFEITKKYSDEYESVLNASMYYEYVSKWNIWKETNYIKRFFPIKPRTSLSFFYKTISPETRQKCIDLNTFLNTKYPHSELICFRKKIPLYSHCSFYNKTDNYSTIISKLIQSTPQHKLISANITTIAEIFEFEDKNSPYEMTFEYRNVRYLYKKYFSNQPTLNESIRLDEFHKIIINLVTKMYDFIQVKKTIELERLRKERLQKIMKVQKIEIEKYYENEAKRKEEDRLKQIKQSNRYRSSSKSLPNNYGKKPKQKSKLKYKRNK